ncbi:MAG TPA: cation:proton antiporter [Vicinamibacterales bacterium]|nr:cation:proton antiporter [Vicinamibacterales bacterium]
MAHSLQLLLLLALVVMAAKLAGAAATRIGQPAVFGEILAGLLLGPTLADILGWSVFAHAAGNGGAPSLLESLRDLAQLGVVLLMFIAGMETDLAEMRRTGRVAFWAAAGGVALPMALGAGVAAWFGLPLIWQGIFVGTILTATSVSISAQTLIEIGAIRTREGSAILGAAVIDDVMGIIVLSVVVALARSAGAVDTGELGLIVGRMVLFFALALAAGRLFPTLTRAGARLPVSQGLAAVVVSVAFVYAWAAEHLGGVAAITGSYLAGLLFARTKEKPAIDEAIHPLTYSVFVPVFFVSIGLQADARDLGGAPLFVALLLAAAVVGKVVGCGVLARLTGFDGLASLRLGVGMISRGEVGLIVAGYGLTHGLIARDVFSASVVIVLVTTMMTPPLLKLTFARPRRRRQPAVVEETVGGPPGEIDRR